MHCQGSGVRGRGVRGRGVRGRELVARVLGLGLGLGLGLTLNVAERRLREQRQVGHHAEQRLSRGVRLKRVSSRSASLGFELLV